MAHSKSLTTHSYISNHLRQLIYYHLDCDLFKNALFFAGRLHAYEPRSSEAAYLLALCHLRLGQLRAAYDFSKTSGARGAHLGCSYVFAQACLGLGRYLEGATALERSKILWSTRNNWAKHTDTRRQHLPDAAAVLCLKGKLWQSHCEHNKAIECYAEALKTNPFMWDAFLGLCDLGVNVRMPNIFKMTTEMTASLVASAQDDTSLGSLDESPPSNPLTTSHPNVLAAGQQPSANDPFSISKNRVNGDTRTNGGNLALFEKFNGAKNYVSPIINGRPNGNGDETPIVYAGVMNPDFFSAKDIKSTSASTLTVEPPLAPMRKPRPPQALALDTKADAPPRMATSSTIRSKSRSKADSEEQDHFRSGRAGGTGAGGTELKRTVSGKSIPSTSTNLKADTNAASSDPGAPQRRSVRLFNQIRPQTGRFAASNGGNLGTKEGREMRRAKAPGTKSRTTNHLNVGRVISGNRKHDDPMEIDGKEQGPNVRHPEIQPKPVVSERSKDLDALQSLIELMTKLGTGYFALSHYQCQDALRCFNTLAVSQRDTPWVLSQIGRAQYEQASYAEAEKTFARLRVLAPYRNEDVEVYSTILWHLKNDVDLAFLSHESIDLDRTSPQAWCAVGNSFSLQRDHDQALKCFKRATQLDPRFAYAYTLQGHEHISNEEHDKAMHAYRASISADNRHYNAWYGLGRVFEKQGKYTFAEQHYRTAASINPTNAVLITCIGVVLEKMKNPRGALVQYARACELSEKSALCRFKKARVLMTLGEAEKSLTELKVLKDIAPDEANVHFLLGKVYRALKQKGQAVRHFTMALNLDPKVCSSAYPMMLHSTDRTTRLRTTLKKPWSRWRMKMKMMSACEPACLQFRHALGAIALGFVHAYMEMANSILGIGYHIGK